MSIPKSIAKHEDDYKNRAWEEYTFCELGWWVELLTLRASHRSNPIKADKDLYDASNYIEIMRAKLDNIITKWEKE